MDRLVFILFRSAAAVVCLLPLTAGFTLGRILGGIVWFVAGKYRRLALHNLRIAFAGEKSEREFRAIGREHFQLLGGNLFASLKLPTLSRQELEAVTTIEGLEHMDPQLAKKGGFVFLISHLGNWELFGQIAPYAFQCKTGTIYQALGNPFIDAHVRRDRARLGLTLFEKKEGFTQAAKFVREGGAVGVLADQHAGDTGLWCPFFGRLASTTTLTATLAQRSGAVLMAAAVHTVGIARWKIVFRPEIPTDGESPAAITTRLNLVLEDQVRERPADWFWVHNRWKLPRPKFLLATYKRGIAFPPGFDPKNLKPFRLVIRAGNWLGDAAMSIPAVRAIRQGRPDLHLTILTPAKLGDLWRAIPDVDEVISIASADTVFGVAKKLRAGGFDAALVFPNSFRTALEPWLARIPRRVGFPGHRRSWLLNQIWRAKKSRNPRLAPPKHQVHDYLALAKFIGADAADIPHSAFRIPHSHEPKLRFGLCPGAEYGPAKRWLPDRFAETMRRVHAETGCEWHLFGVLKDRPIADEILAAATGIPVVDRIGKTTLAELIAELRECELLLTNDTGTMHLAAIFGVPVVAIFGSTEPRLTGPLGSGHVIIRHHVPCSPCFLRECPIDFRCMKAIEVDEVTCAIVSIHHPEPSGLGR